jgi:hypothetical protein
MYRLIIAIPDIEENAPFDGMTVEEMFNMAGADLVHDAGQCESGSVYFTISIENRNIIFRSLDKNILDHIDWRVGQTAGELFTRSGPQEETE